MSNKLKINNRLKIPINKNFDKVVVRFAPEPSGCLHIGHAKPILLNQVIKEDFDGSFILRFDDTNPKKETTDFHDSIIKDIESLGIDIDLRTYTSNYFDFILEQCSILIDNGDAYLDCTEENKMKEQRLNKVPSEYRNTNNKDNLKIFNEEFINNNKSKWCVRAKIDYKNNNGCLRDPVIYRACDKKHIKHGYKYNVYPTYDFCCPIVDYLENISHALRANEYRDHYEIYKWVIRKLNLLLPSVIHFSKLKFQNTVMSKRYLKYIVENNIVDGWDDPRLPTIKGLFKAGLTYQALKDYVISMGINNNSSLPSWDKLWAINKKIIDKYIPRYSSIDSNKYTKLIVEGFPDDPNFTINGVLHPKNKELGKRRIYKYKEIIINQYDSSLLEEGDRVGLLRCSVIEIDKIVKLNGETDYILCNVSHDPNFKTTKYKINWLACSTLSNELYDVYTYGPLLIKENMEDNDSLDDIINKNSKGNYKLIIERCINDLPEGSIIQLERRGYFIKWKNGLNCIPDGRQKNMIN